MTDTKTITDGNGTTKFFDVSGDIRLVKPGTPPVYLPGDTIGRTMLFVPQAVTVAWQAPMVIYYHGHHGPALIDDYITEMPERDFRPLLKSLKVVLVEPQGGPLSKFGMLGTPAGVSKLINQAMSAALRITTRGPGQRMPDPQPKPWPLIFVGFSGGGATLKNVVITDKADYASQITEAWCFDCMYSGEGNAWVKWTTKYKKLRVRCSTEEGTGSPRAQAEVIRQAKKAHPALNIDIADTVKSTHEGLPGMFLPEFIQKIRSDNP